MKTLHHDRGPRRFVRFVMLVLLVLSVGLASHAASPLGRKQVILFPDSVVERSSSLLFAQMKKVSPHSNDPKIVAQVHCIVDAIHNANRGILSTGSWDVVVFKSKKANAFAVPGGKIGVYEGLLDFAVNQHQLAAVLGHEMAHVEARHGNERVSAEFAAGLGVSLVAIALGSGENRVRLLAALGFGVQVGVLLPFSRTHEKEADILGLDYMARAGFDPRESIALWHNMQAKPSIKPPSIISSHPSSRQRIAELSNRMGHARNLHREALSKGHLPFCAI